MRRTTCVLIATVALLIGVVLVALVVALVPPIALILIAMLGWQSTRSNGPADFLNVGSFLITMIVIALIGGMEPLLPYLDELIGFFVPFCVARYFVQRDSWPRAVLSARSSAASVALSSR